MKDELFLAWAAGFFDGEGSVIVELSKEKACRHGFRTSLHANVTQTSLPCLQLLLERFGGAIRTHNTKTPNGRRWSVSYVWVSRNKEAADFLTAIRPYSVVKQTQIDAALKYPLLDANGRKYGNPGNPIPEDVMAVRLAVRQMLKDIRASMKEPAAEAKNA
jgi:hypothetical protein